MARWLLSGIALVTLAACGQEKSPPALASNLSTAEQELVGDWLGQMVVTEEKIDDYHKAYPEGDRDSVRRMHEWWASRPMGIVRLNEDGTGAILTSDGQPGGPEGKWTLSNDGKKLTFTYQSPVSTRTTEMVDGKPVNKDDEYEQSVPMVYDVSADFRSFSDEHKETIYYKRGSAEARVAFKEVAETPIEFAPAAESNDFIGLWVVDMTLADDGRDYFRSTLSEKELEDMQDRLDEVKVEVEVKKDGTFIYRVMDEKRDGTWSLDPDRQTAVLTTKPKEIADPLGEAILRIRLSKDKSSGYLFTPELVAGRPARLVRVKSKA